MAANEIKLPEINLSVLSKILIGAVLVAALVFFLKLPGGFWGERGIASLILNIEGKQRFFEGRVMENMTVLQALYSASKNGGFELRYYLDGDGRMKILTIDGDKTLVGQWFFYLNDRQLDSRFLSKIQVSPGDIIRAEFR